MTQLPPESNTQIDLTGKSVGEYYLIRRLGRGGMADVYLATQTSLKRNVAFKILKPELAQDQSYVERFRREAQAAAALVQANIVQIYEVGELDGFHFIAQEYVPGRNLKQYIARYGALDVPMAVSVLRQVALALQKAGEMNVIHRDIKPENIMISNDGEVKVTDFGLARVKNESMSPNLTQIGVTMGTPLYMSPEQIGGEEVDPRSDLYSLGVTAYHMLAGRPPFEGDNALAIAMQQVNEIAEPLNDIRPDCPPELCELIRQMMQKAPNERPNDASELTRELKRIKGVAGDSVTHLIDKQPLADTSRHTSTTEARLAATRQLEAVMRGKVRRWWTNPATWLLFLALMLLGLGCGAWLAFSEPPADPLASNGQFFDSIEKEPTVKEQYRKAYWGNTEQHWKSVIEYFPLDEAEDKNNTLVQHNRARARLGELYINQEMWSDASDVYQYLRELEDVNSKRFNTIGWAGQAIVEDALNESDDEVQLAKIKNALSHVETDDHMDLLNPFFRKRVETLLLKYGLKNALN